MNFLNRHQLTIIDSNNGSLPVRCQAIIWTSAGLLLAIIFQRTFLNASLLQIFLNFLFKFHSFTLCLIACKSEHYNDVIMGMMASHITSLTTVYSTVYLGEDQRKHQSSTSLAFVWGIHRGPVNSPHKWPVTWKMFPLDDVIMLFHVSAWCKVSAKPLPRWMVSGLDHHMKVYRETNLPITNRWVSARKT